MTEIYLTISLSTHNGDDTPQNSLSLLADSLPMKKWLTSNITILATLDRY